MAYNFVETFADSIHSHNALLQIPSIVPHSGLFFFQSAAVKLAWECPPYATVPGNSAVRDADSCRGCYEFGHEKPVKKQCPDGQAFFYGQGCMESDAC